MVRSVRARANVDTIGDSMSMDDLLEDEMEFVKIDSSSVVFSTFPIWLSLVSFKIN